MRRPKNTIDQTDRDQKTGLLARFLILTALLLTSASAFSAGVRLSGFSEGDSILIRAENAWEDATADTLHFSGQFELKAQDWYLSADQATLYGSLDDPEKAILTGSPASIQLETTADNRVEIIRGEASRIVYRRASNSISLTGGARLSRDGQMMQSENIEYDIDQDHIQAGGEQGVSIRADPANQLY